MSQPWLELEDSTIDAVLAGANGYVYLCGLSPDEFRSEWNRFYGPRPPEQPPEPSLPPPDPNPTPPTPV